MEWVDGAAAAAALRTFPGVARRFQHLGTTAEGCQVIDDYAHNGEKLPQLPPQRRKVVSA